MKTLTNIRKIEKHLGALLLIGIFVFQSAVKASEFPPKTEVSYETEEMVEDWMLDLSSWAKNSNACASEAELEIEDWMFNLNSDVWKTDFEEELEIEEWMYDVNHCYWNCGISVETEMSIEDWMLDPSGWLNNQNLFTQASL